MNIIATKKDGFFIVKENLLLSGSFPTIKQARNMLCYLAFLKNRENMQTEFSIFNEDGKCIADIICHNNFASKEHVRKRNKALKKIKYRNARTGPKRSRNDFFKANNMRKNNNTYKNIGIKFGVSPTRASQMCAQGNCMMKKIILNIKKCGVQT